MIIYGSIFGGKVEELDKQWIESKYFLLMIPLVPISTMFVTDSKFRQRNGFQISYGKSVGHGYLRFFTLILAIACFGFSLFGDMYTIEHFPVSPSIAGTLFGLLYAWSNIDYRFAKGEQKLERKRLGAIVGLNALPEWMPANLRIELEEKIRQQIMQVFGHDNIKSIVQNPASSVKHTALLYAYLRYKMADRINNVAYIKEYDTVLNRYNQALLKNTDVVFNELHKQMPDDLTDDATKQIEKAE